MPPRQRSDSDDEAQHAQRRSKKKKQLKEDLRAVQIQVLEAQEAARRAQEENEALRQQLHQQNAGERRHADEDEPQLSKSEVKFWKKAAKVAGRRAAAMHAPFLDADCLADHQVQDKMEDILEDVKNAKDSDGELEDDENPAIYFDTPRFGLPEPVEMARELIFHLPKSPGNIWLDEWFQDALKTGIRKQRGDIVHAVAKRYEKIFGITDPAFEERSRARAELPEVKALLENFMHIGEETERGDLDFTLFFRDDCIVRVLRLLLNGPSAIRNGRRSAKARKPHSKMWHVKQITPSLLAFAATVIKFVLSGEPSFEEASGSVNYTDWFLGRLTILKGVHTHHPEVYEDLIDYYNRSVLPELHPNIENHDDQDRAGAQGDRGGLSAQDKAFLERLRAPN